MPNAWVHPNLIAAEALSVMSDNLVWGANTTRDLTGQFVNTEMKIGDTINLRTTPDYDVKDFYNDGVNTIDKQSIRAGSIPFKIQKIFDVSVEITNREKSLDLDSFTSEVIAPAAIRLAEAVDHHIASMAYIGAGSAYASSDLFGTVGDMAAARNAANYRQMNKASRVCFVGGNLETKLLGKDYFYNASIRGDGPNQAALSEGFLARTMGFDFISEQISGVDSFGTFPAFGTGATSTDNSGGANLLGMTTLKVASTTNMANGDMLLIAGCRRPFIIGTVVNATTVNLLYPIMEIVPDAAAVTTLYGGQTPTAQGLMMDGRAVGLAMPPLGKPSDKPSFVINSNGYSLRVVQGYDMEKKVEILSIDTMVGAGVIDPRRITILADL